MAKIMTLGFIGTGKPSKKQAIVLLEDYLGEAGARFVIPVTPEHFGEGMKAVADWAIENDIPYDAVVTDDSGADKRLGKYVKEASATHKVVRVPHKIISLLDKADDPTLIVLWDDEDEDSFKAIERAAGVGIESLDLTNQLDLLEIEEDEDGEEEFAPHEGEDTKVPDEEEQPEEEEETEPPKAKAGRKRRGRAVEEDPEPEPKKKATRTRAKVEEPDPEPEEGDETGMTEEGFNEAFDQGEPVILANARNPRVSAEELAEEIVKVFNTVKSGTKDVEFARVAAIEIIRWVGF